ncbi:hypothetical protein [Chryseolinea lacunae]|uniref:Carrier domain-containing protein n=1 Tax=Chryseolinea lacunae TaxID=2801331 RepID=A0ABS1KRC9_9BACT|nr:hypothetical protein [Chryseolinea lacunae]
MGLDTVELLMTMEKHFSIAIPDREASGINTVQDFADCVCAKITLSPGSDDKREVIYHRLTEVLQSQLGIEPDVIHREAKIKEVLMDRDVKSCWKNLEAGLELKLPSLTSLDLDATGPRQRKFFGIKLDPPIKAVTEGSLRELISWIMALNHRQLLDPRTLGSKAEVENIVLGIVSESCGIPVSEIEMRHSITSDLGMD